MRLMGSTQSLVEIKVTHHCMTPAIVPFPEDLMKALIPILLTPVRGALGPLSRPSPSPQRSIKIAVRREKIFITNG